MSETPTNTQIIIKDDNGQIHTSKSLGQQDETRLNNMVKLMNLILQTPNSADFINTLANKDLSNCTKPHIVETYHNGTSWYRVYSDGFCEQGGYGSWTFGVDTVVTLLKNYLDTDYKLFAQHNNSSSGTIGYSSIRSKTTSSFNYYETYSSGGTTTKFSWVACGYIR